MLRFLLALGYPILIIPLYLEWSRRQAEQQIDKMQRSVFNSPGAEAPVPPLVILLGAILLAGYWAATRLFGVGGWLRGIGALIGVPVGVAIFTKRQTGRGK